MNLKVNKEMISTTEVIYDGLQEQSVELDYILPDYYPDIFKMVKCQLSPKVISYTFNGDRATYELIAEIKIMYCSEQSNMLQCITQKLNYTKTVDFNQSCKDVNIKFKPKVDYINCRVVNQRRLDIRGAVSTKIKATCEQNQEVVSDVFGMNSQLLKKPVSYVTGKLNAFKNVIISEEIDLSVSKPAVMNIIRSDAIVTVSDKKIISNKLVAKGEVTVNVLYSCEDEGLDTMQFTLPYSQVVDVEGIDDEYECIIDGELAECNIAVSANNDGEMKILHCQINIALYCTAMKTSIVELITDAYSTTYPCEFACANIRIDQIPEFFSETFQEKSTLEYREGEIQCVYDSWTQVTSINAKVNEDNTCVILNGVLKCIAIGKNEMGMPILLEQDEQFEHSIAMEGLTENSIIEPEAIITCCSYTLASVNSVDIKVDVKICGKMYNSFACEILKDIEFDEQHLKERDGNYALKLYYGTANERIWEIAKKYSTSVLAIMEENELMEDKLPNNMMVLIPIVG